jgi:hypothetical protein
MATGLTKLIETVYGPLEQKRRYRQAFLRNYPQGQWIVRERERLTSAIKRAAGEGAGNEGTAR